MADSVSRKLGDVLVMRIPWILWYAVVLHSIWGMLFLYDARAGWATAPHGILRLCGGNAHVSGLVLLVCSLCAVYGILGYPWRPRLALLALLPQQILMLLTGFSVVKAIVWSQFADGVVRPWVFILADQSAGLLAALAHTGAILSVHGVFGGENR